MNKNIETDENDLKRTSSNPENPLSKDKELSPVPISFMDIEEYIKIWQNLFFLEAKAQIMKAKFLEVFNGFLMRFYENFNVFFLRKKNKRLII
jgi:hypothetical protein